MAEGVGFTHDTLAGIPHFACGGFDHEATSRFAGRRLCSAVGFIAADSGAGNLGRAMWPKRATSHKANISELCSGNQPVMDAIYRRRDHVATLQVTYHYRLAARSDKPMKPDQAAD